MVVPRGHALAAFEISVESGDGGLVKGDEPTLVELRPEDEQTVRREVLKAQAAGFPNAKARRREESEQRAVGVGTK
jgi:hypothetical protein